MKMHKSITEARVIKAVRVYHSSNPGFCIVCGEDAMGVEPDARGYECEACGKRGVYGAEEILLHMGA